MPMLKMSILSIALLATLPAAAVYSVADGTDGDLPMIFAQATGSGTSGKEKWIIDPSMWGDNAIPHNDADYVIMSNRTQYVQHTYTAFDGHSLQIGTSDYKLKNNWSKGDVYFYNRGAGYVVSFENAGLVLVNGSFAIRYYYDTLIDGQVRVLSDADHPFLFYNGETSSPSSGKPYEAGYLHFRGPVSGPSTASLRVRGHRDNVKGFGLKVGGDWSQYYGNVVVTGELDTVGTYFPLGSIRPAELWITNTVFAGTATIHDGCLIRSLVAGEPFTISNLVLKAGATFTLSGDVTVGSLAMEGGANINVVPSADGMRIPTITVLDSVSISGGAVNVAIDGFAATNGVNTAVFQFPAGATVSEDDFRFTGSATTWRPASPDQVVIAPDAETGRLAVVPLFYPSVTLLASDDTSRTTEKASSLTNATHWSDGREPHGLAHYNLATKDLRFYDVLPCKSGNVPTLDYVFPGLSIAAPANSDLTIICHSVTVSNFYVIGSPVGVYMPAYTNALWHGPVEIAAGCTLNLNIGYGKQFTWDGEISGAGNLTLRGLHGGSTGTPSGYSLLTSLNTNFAGTVTLTIPVGSTSDPGRTTPQFDPDKKKFFTAHVRDARNLGGAMSPANPKGIVIHNMSRLAVALDATEVTFDEPTRGIFIDWVGRFYVTADKTLTVNSPLAVHGTMYKEGNGILSLGSAVKFGADGTLDQWEEGEAATNHAFVVHAGDVRIRHADALNGLNVTVTNAASSFLLAANAADDDLRTYGIRNVKTATPFAVEGANTRLNIRLEAPEREIKSQDTFGLVTVPLDQTNVVAQLLSVQRPKTDFDGFRLTVALEANADGETATFKAIVKTHGTLFTIR